MCKAYLKNDCHSISAKVKKKSKIRVSTTVTRVALMIEMLETCSKEYFSTTKRTSVTKLVIFVLISKGI